MGILRILLTQIETVGGKVISSTKKSLSIRIGVQGQSLIISAKMHERDYYERAVVISFSDTDFYMKFVACPTTTHAEDALEGILRSIVFVLVNSIFQKQKEGKPNLLNCQ